MERFDKEQENLADDDMFILEPDGPPHILFMALEILVNIGSGNALPSVLF